MYNWQHQDWANYIYNEQVVNKYALQLAELMGEVVGMFNTIESREQQNEIIGLMISEALKTSSIEGEMLSREDLMSSIRKQLGLDGKIKNIRDKRAENVAQLMLKVRDNYTAVLSEEMIKDWHKVLFDGSKYINAGNYRKGAEPMQIISGAFGRETVHYEAPPSEAIPKEMKHFIKWYNNFKTENNILKVIVKAAIAHLYFESIHPFEDGNGRIGRALIEKCLAESLDRQIILSVSTAIDEDKKSYYSKLNKASQTLKIDDWLIYFAKLLVNAQQNAINVIRISIRKTQFFDTYSSMLNKRQTKVLQKMFDNGAENFKGGMTARKYISIAKTTKTTATRDLQELVAFKIFTRCGDGRSTHYILKL